MLQTNPLNEILFKSQSLGNLGVHDEECNIALQMVWRFSWATLNNPNLRRKSLQEKVKFLYGLVF